MNSVRKAAFVLALLAVLVFGCKKTPEEAIAAWHSNEEAIQKVEAKYPAFKPALEDLLASAKKDFEAAKPDADKMHAATDRLVPATKMFEPYEKESDRLGKLMKDKELGDLPASKINPAMDAAKAAVTKSDGLIKDSKPANMGEAKGKVEDATKTLKAAADTLEALKPKPAASATPAAPAASSAKPAAAPAKSAAPAGKK